MHLEPPATDADECCRQLAAAVRQGGRASCAGGPSNFTVSCALDDVAAVSSIRNAVLSGAYDRRASDATRRRVRADRACFVEALGKKRAEDAEKLTPHQRQVLENLPETGDVHLRAPAGAARRTGASIERTRRSNAVPTCCFVQGTRRWRSSRAAGSTGGARGPRAFLRAGRPVRGGAAEGAARGRRVTSRERRDRVLLVNGSGRGASCLCQRRATEIRGGCVSPPSKRVLLSDASQGASAVAYPPAHAAELTEVVRCSQRVVAGAMAFQLGGDRKLLTASVSEDAGPPLKSFLFDVEDNRFEATAKYCLPVCNQPVRRVDGVGKTLKFRFPPRSGPRARRDVVPGLRSARPRLRGRAGRRVSTTAPRDGRV